MNERKTHRFGVGVIAAMSIGMIANSALAGGLLDIKYEDVLARSLIIDNPYWPLNPDGATRTFTYISETADE